ncbi:PorT family protein [bacterium]|nr:PorT family protein [bacterium]
MKSEIRCSILRALTVIILASAPLRGIAQQELVFVVHADPVISWMGSNESEYVNEGSKAGYDIGLNVLHFFAENYAISSGISILSAGGRQSVTEDITMVFNNFTRDVEAGEEIRYNLRYLNIPAGLRLQTNQAGLMTYWTDLGFDIRLLLKSTIDIPSAQIDHENAKTEVYGLNLGWHLGGGIEYEMDIDASIVAGLSYGQDFFDVTKDLEDVYQPEDRSGLRMFRIVLGIKF